MSKSSIYLPRVSDPVVVENCHPQKYYLISTNEFSIRVGSNIWSKIRDHYTRTMKDNPNQDFIPYELYLNKEKRFKMIGIERKNYGTEIKFHIMDILSSSNYIIDFHKDIINVESQEYHEKRKKYLEENRDAINERYRQQYQEKKLANQTVKKEVPVIIPETVKEESKDMGISMEMMALFSSIVDANKVAEKKKELESLKEKCNLMQKMLDIFS